MKKRNNKERVDYFFEIFFVILNVLIIILFYKNASLTTVLVLIIAIIGLFKWKSRRTLFIFLGVAIAGAGLEMICIEFGVWEYTVTDFYNIPFWLFIIWGSAAATIYQISKKIKEKKLK